MAITLRKVGDTLDIPLRYSGFLDEEIVKAVTDDLVGALVWSAQMEVTLKEINNEKLDITRYSLNDVFLRAKVVDVGADGKVLVHFVCNIAGPEPAEISSGFLGGIPRENIHFRRAANWPEMKSAAQPQ